MTSAIYEWIGRFVVRFAWLRYGRQIKLAGTAALLAVVGAGWLLSRRDPPEG